jgi:hypothetical protein
MASNRFNRHESEIKGERERERESKREREKERERDGDSFFLSDRRETSACWQFPPHYLAFRSDRLSSTGGLDVPFQLSPLGLRGLKRGRTQRPEAPQQGPRWSKALEQGDLKHNLVPMLTNDKTWAIQEFELRLTSHLFVREIVRVAERTSMAHAH